MNALYDKGREGFLGGDIAWDSDNIKTVLVDTDVYTVNLATHQFHSDLSGIVATSTNLASKTIADGVADSSDVVFGSVVGPESEALVVYQDSGTPSTSRLIAYIDTVTGLPVTPNGGDITIQWDSGANKIFKL